MFPIKLETADGLCSRETLWYVTKRTLIKHLITKKASIPMLLHSVLPFDYIDLMMFQQTLYHQRLTLSLLLRPPDLNATCKALGSVLKIQLHILVCTPFILLGFLWFVYWFAAACCHTQRIRRDLERRRDWQWGLPPRYPRCLRRTEETATPALHLRFKKQEMTGHGAGLVYPTAQWGTWFVLPASLHLSSFSTRNFLIKIYICCVILWL